MKKIVVRPAHAIDLGEIEDVARRPFAARWSREAYAAELERTDSLFLVADDGTACGYAVARLVGDEAQLFDLAVGVDGNGTGRALWAALSDAARSRGASKLTLEVSSGNARAMLFYRRAGARVVGRRPKFYNDGSDAVLFDFALS